MVEHLSLGGGIVYLQKVYGVGLFVDLGFCTDFSFQPEVTEEFADKYISDSTGNISRVSSAIGAVTVIGGSGSFACDSLSRDMLQNVWFHGNATSAGTELFGGASLTPIVRGLRFLSAPATGPTFCLLLPAVTLTITSPISLMSHEFTNIQFTFKVIFAENMNTVPTLRVQEEGEELTNFCT